LCKAQQEQLAGRTNQRIVPISQHPARMLLAQRTVGVDVLDINPVIADAVILPGHS
jgi:hypothetical protein